MQIQELSTTTAVIAVLINRIPEKKELFSWEFLAHFQTSEIQVGVFRVCHSYPDFHRDKLQQSLPRT